MHKNTQLEEENARLRLRVSTVWLPSFTQSHEGKRHTLHTDTDIDINMRTHTQLEEENARLRLRVSTVCLPSFTQSHEGK